VTRFLANQLLKFGRSAPSKIGFGILRLLNFNARDQNFDHHEATTGKMASNRLTYRRRNP
jgi:hypothetical protein